MTVGPFGGRKKGVIRWPGWNIQKLGETVTETHTRGRGGGGGGHRGKYGTVSVGQLGVVSV